MNMKHAHLRQVCSIERGGVNPQARPDEIFAHYSIPAYDDGMIPVLEAGAAIKSQKTRISRGAVLVSKLNPRIPRVWIVDDEQICQRICSTEFVPFRPDPGRLLPEFLGYSLRYLLSTRQITGSTSAATKSRERARPDAIADLMIPLPNLDDQRRIVDLLSRAAGIVRLRREAQKKAAEIIPALFLDMFGDPAANPKGWLVRPLGELLARSIRNGVSPSRTGTHKGRVLTLSAITSGTFDATAVKDATFAAPLGESDEVSKEDFLVCRGNGNRELVGVACFPDSDMRGVAFPDTAIAVRPRANLLGRRFLAVQWQTLAVRQQVEKIAKTTNGTYKINQTGLSGVRLILPPEAAQQTFDERARSLESITRQQAQALVRAKATFRALLARAFSSDLAAAAMVEEAAAA